MVILYRIIGYIGIIGGFISLFINNSALSKADKNYFVFGGIVAIIYGIIALFKASYFEELRNVTESTNDYIKAIYTYLNQQAQKSTPPPATPPAPVEDEFSNWKRKK